MRMLIFGYRARHSDIKSSGTIALQVGQVESTSGVASMGRLGEMESREELAILIGCEISGVIDLAFERVTLPERVLGNVSDGGTLNFIPTSLFNDWPD